MAELVRAIQQGKLSRNRHFEAFKDPLVQEARTIHRRLQSLTQLLEQHPARELEVAAVRERNQVRVDVKVTRLHLSWTARFSPTEYGLLLERHAVQSFPALHGHT
ncbi:hypothetical protein [Acanthopleuribacter pedis]|uniref:Uncharacterized protein n=1 Tax=Acanthopleuribacter pedis TaxID=442870 RepID=A0A8J7U5U2_9BACT|nr:hypothetical protein [Acanthopleuribacter pedis]MBO1321209.1 hypothetical protein [Acanthopleuribacter pedis]